MTKIGILGEGWLGSYLLQRLQENGFDVRGAKSFGCYFRNNRWEGELSVFLEGLSYLIITIPSGASRNTSDHKEGNLPLFKQLIGHLNRNPNLTVFYTSSISVYGKSERVIDENLVNFTILEKDNEINIFFDKETYELIGWQNTDIYQNFNITYLSSIRKNRVLSKNLFKIPSQN